MQQLTSTIKPNELTLADWIAIAMEIGNTSMWAYGEWMDISTFDKTQLTFKDWEAIADELGEDETWAYYRYTEHRL